MMLERTVPDQGAEIDGYHIPGGTTVGVNPWLVNFEKDIFGDDVHDFRPGRWLDADADKTGEMRRMLFTVSHGALPSPPLAPAPSDREEKHSFSDMMRGSLELGPEVA